MEAIYSDFYPRFIYVDKYRFSSNWVFPTSSAPYGLLRYIVSGSATFILNGICYEVAPDDVFYIPQDSLLSCSAKEEIVFISIRFVGSIQSQGTDLFQELWDIPILRSFSGTTQMKQYFEAVYASALSRHNFKMLEIRGRLNLIFALLAQCREANLCQDTSLEEDRAKMEALFDVKSIQLRASKSAQQKNDPRITALEDYIITHPTENLSHAKMCEIADVSESTLRRLFKAKTGKTIYAYVREIKMTNAARRLLITNEPIAAISYALGYETPSYFSKCFREIFGMTPQEYRKTSHEA